MARRTQQAQLEHDVDALAAQDAEDALIEDEDPPGKFGPLGDAIEDTAFAWVSLWLSPVPIRPEEN